MTKKTPYFIRATTPMTSLYTPLKNLKVEVLWWLLGFIKGMWVKICYAHIVEFLRPHSGVSTPT
jgi:hypothetical protein